MKNATHFVRFENAYDERFQRAVALFGPPDFLHRHWDYRALAEIMPGDVIVFAKGDEGQKVTLFSYDDSAYQ